MNDLRVQAVFKRSKKGNKSLFIFFQDYYELPQKTIGVNGNIHDVFEPNNFKDVQNPYKNQTNMDTTISEYKFLTSTCCNEKNQLITFDMTKVKYTGPFRLGLNSIFVPGCSLF